jgi:hypothetical protein
MDGLETESWLVLLFGHRLSLALVPKDDLGAGFRAAGRAYRSPNEDHLTTFYDRIVDARGDLVGIRIHPARASVEGWLAGVPASPSVRNDGGVLDVWLRGAPMPDAESMGDQAFGGQVFLSDDGEVALSLDVNYLCTSDAELAAILAATGDWVTLEIADFPTTDVAR